MREIWTLFWTFAKIGCFTFGGGYAMLSLIQKEIVEKYQWATNEEVLDYYAIGQCTPGVIAVNTATFIGSKRKGVLGAAAATFGVVLPSIIIISIVAMFVQNFLQYKLTTHFFNGIRVVVAVLVVNATLNMGKKAIVDKLCIGIALIAAVLSFFCSTSPILLVTAAACVGLFIKRKAGGRDA